MTEFQRQKEIVTEIERQSYRDRKTELQRQNQAELRRQKDESYGDRKTELQRQKDRGTETER